MQWQWHSKGQENPRSTEESAGASLIQQQEYKKERASEHGNRFRQHQAQLQLDVICWAGEREIWRLSEGATGGVQSVSSSSFAPADDLHEHPCCGDLGAQKHLF